MVGESRRAGWAALATPGRRRGRGRVLDDDRTSPHGFLRRRLSGRSLASAAASCPSGTTAPAVSGGVNWTDRVFVPRHADETSEVRNLIGCNMSFRRDLVEAAGRFRLGYSCDETDLCIRLSVLRPNSRLLTARRERPASRPRHPRNTETLRDPLLFRGRLQGCGCASGRCRARVETEPRIRAKCFRPVCSGASGYLLRAGILRAGPSSSARRHGSGLPRGSVRVQRAAERRGWPGPASDGGPCA